MTLPAAAQAVKDKLTAESTAANEATPPVAAVPDTTEQVPTIPSAADKVTISREEFNELQAAADRLKAAEGRAELMQDDLAAFKARLTDLETAAKARPQEAAPAPAAPTIEIPKIEFTQEELKDYADSSTFIGKKATEALIQLLPVINQTIKAEIQAQLEPVLAKIGEVDTTVRTTAQKTEVQLKKEFTEKVREQVTDFDECVNNKFWKAFLESTEETSGLTYGECIVNNLENRRNVEVMVSIFNRFKQKYGVGKKVDASGYQGAQPSGTTATPTEPGGKEVLKFSDRKKLSEMFRNQKIPYKEYEEQKAKFDQADKENRLDYNA